MTTTGPEERDDREQEDDRMSLTEVARRLNVAYGTVARWAANGDIPARRVSRGTVPAYEVSRRELEAWIASDAAVEITQIRPRRLVSGQEPSA